MASRRAKKTEKPWDPLWHLPISPDDFIGYVPTPVPVVRRMLELAEIRRGETVYDLGCGDGRILIRAVEDYGARGVGIDIDGDRLDIARWRARRHLRRIDFRRQNLFRANLRSADVVMIYLLPQLNEKLLPQLDRLRAGVRIISHSFELPGVVPDKTARRTIPGGLTHYIFFYRTPLRRA